jgi:hypothetical protein
LVQTSLAFAGGAGHFVQLAPQWSVESVMSTHWPPQLP